jgi:peptidoglycan/LPS O-acetylase OafA/YrhL
MAETQVGANADADGSHRRGVVGLDVIRFAAAFMVMVYHLAYLSWAKPDSTSGLLVEGLRFEAAAPLTAFGWVGVEIFFVLSGLVIAYSADGSSPFSFAKSRLVRLYPGAWICASISACALAFAGLYGVTDLAIRYVRTMVLIPTGPWVDGVYWTLGVEMAFYAVVLLTLCANGFRSAHRLFYALAGISAAYWIAWLTWPQGVEDLPPLISRLGLFEHGVFFAIGGMMWMWIRRGGLTLAHVAMFAAAVLAGLIEIYSVALERQVYEMASPPFVAMAVWLVSIALMIASLRYNDRIWTPRRAHLSRAMGLATYPLYLLHSVVGAVLMQALAPLPILALVSGMIGVTLLSFAICLAPEKRVQDALRQLVDLFGTRLHGLSPAIFRRTDRFLVPPAG